ncbi:hypothetical protein EZS27_019075 [termite gut metagenome]|uniref:Uncharacterized protein n=1 Tax=termite gut metagenome TaxID=433724 RepID=A0A5J4REA6_9ZZZZ
MTSSTILDRMSKQANELAALISTGKTATSKSRTTTALNSFLQQMQFSHIANVYTLLKRFVIGTFEEKSRKKSYYNFFMKYNLGGPKVYLTKSEATVKACVVAPYTISQGSLQPIEMTQSTGMLVTSIRLPQGFDITATTTVGEVSLALIKQNASMQKGDQLSLVHLVQTITGEKNIPRVLLRLHEFVLNPASQTIFYDQIPKALFTVNGGYVSTDANAEAGGIAYVLSRREGSKLLVSTQTITLTPGNTIYKKYSSEEKKQEALESYGIVTRILFADPEKPNTKQDPEDDYFTISGVTLNGASIGEGSGELGITSGDVLEIKGSKLTEVELKANITIGGPTSNPITLNLSGLGNVTTSSESSIIIHITITGDIDYLLRSDNSAIVYNFC